MSYLLCDPCFSNAYKNLVGFFTCFDTVGKHPFINKHYKNHILAWELLLLDLKD